MVRLILDEGGERRAFKVNEGTLVIGSGPQATLRLSSADVAEKHAELVVSANGEVALRARPGVQPPLVNGRPAPGETRIAPGSSIAIGAAKLTVQAGEGATPAPAAAGRSASRVQRTRPVAKIEKGIPGWLIAVLLLVGLGGGGFMVYRSTSKRLSAGGADTGAQLATAEAALKTKNWAQVDRLMGELAQQKLDAGQQRRYDAMLAVVKEREASYLETLRNEEGTSFLDTQLKRFEADRLQGNPEKKKIRVFLMRSDEFLRRWPTHPDRDWVERQRERFAGAVDLSQPPTWEEVDYEIETLTWAWPTQFRAAYAVLEPHLSGQHAAKAEERLAALEVLQQARFDDKMQQAKYEWEKPDGAGTGKAVEILRQIIVNFTDQAKVDQAASELVILPGIEGWLRGYKESKPDAFAELAEHPQVRTLARSLELL